MNDRRVQLDATQTDRGPDRGLLQTQTYLVRAEQYVPECTASLGGECLAAAHGGDACALGECVESAPMPDPPALSRATRRAMQRAARRKNR